MREAIIKKLLSGGLAVNDGTTALGDSGPYYHDTPIGNTVVYVSTLASSTTGKVTIESAHLPNYTQTWISEAVVTCATANSLQVVRIVGEMLAVRARVSQTANGSGIDVYIKAS